jgi:large subunit ribosomal protein L5
MHWDDYYYAHVFSRDMFLKMDREAPLLVHFKELTIQYTSKYVLTEKKNILPACVFVQLCGGQSPQMTRAHRSIASFKLREDTVIGCGVTLRKQYLHSFLDGLVNVMLPRIKRLESIVPTRSQHHVHMGLDQLLFFPPLEKSVEMFEFLAGCTVHVHTTATCHVEKLLLCSAFHLPVLLASKND